MTNHLSHEMGGPSDPFKRPCRGCTEKMDETAAVSEIERVLAKLQGKVPFAADEAYAERLNACAACPSLLGNQTCSHCGCFVAVRARLAQSSCPSPAGARWA